MAVAIVQHQRPDVVLHVIRTRVKRLDQAENMSKQKAKQEVAAKCAIDAVRGHALRVKDNPQKWLLLCNQRRELETSETRWNQAMGLAAPKSY